MNLNRSMLVAVAMVLGSLGAMGCKTNKSAVQDGSDVPAPVATPIEEAPAAAKDEAIQAKASVAVSNQAPVQYAPYAPPAPRYENPGRAPNANQLWIEGYYRWSTREYVWVPGHWELRRDGYEYQRTVWVNENGHWTCREGRWMSRHDRMVQERMERERFERERREHARFERERLERERFERSRLERERLERARLERERMERERLERAQQAKADRERLERERLERARLERERLERERLQKVEQERKMRDRIAQDGKLPRTKTPVVNPTPVRAIKKTS